MLLDVFSDIVMKSQSGLVEVGDVWWCGSVLELG